MGDWDVLPASGELRGPRGTQRLRPLLMDILLRLAATPGEVVRRETLLEDVWTRRMVNDEVLSRAIAELRTAIGDEAREARYIETLPKIGYRLVAAIEPLAAEAAPAPPVAAATPRPAPLARANRPWLAVLAGVTAAIVLAAIAIAMRPSSDPAAGIEARLAAARPFTSDPGLELTPRFSPDGTRVAFALGEGNDLRIVVQAVDGSSRQFVGRPGFLRLSPVFFPDGRRIAFWQARGNECAIVEHDLATGAERTLLDCKLGPRSRFDLSRDGRHLVFSAPSRPQHPVGLWVVELDRGTPRPLTAPQPGMGDDFYPRFSPDGSHIAFFRGNESHRQPWLVPRDDGAAARPAAKVEGLSYGLAWLGEAGPLIAAGDWLGFRALVLVDPASGATRLAGARGARFPDVGPRGQLVWENAMYSANLWRVDLARASSPRELWRSTRYSNQPEFSPDGRQIAFSSNRDGADAIYVSAFDGSPRRIAFGEAHRYLRPHWSADGRFVHAVRHTARSGGAAIQEAVRIPVNGGAPEVFGALGRAVNDVRESRDGQWLFWGELSGHSMRLLRAPAGNLERAERLPWPVASQYQLNSTVAVLAQPQLPQLTRCRLDTLACEPMPLEVNEAELYHWALGPRSIFVRVRGAGGAHLQRRDLATGKTTGTFDFAPTGAGTSIAVSPDESTLVVVREEGPAIDLMIAK